MRRFLATGVVATALFVSLACGGDDLAVGPVIDMVTPNSAAAGVSIELEGARFCGTNAEVDPDGTCTTPPAGSVEFGAEAPVMRGSIMSWTDTTITVGVPSGASAGLTSIVVKVNDEVSNIVEFTVE